MTDGNVHAVFNNLTGEQIDNLKADDRIANAGVSDTDLAISGIQLDNDKEDRFRTGNIAYGDPDYFKQMIVSDYEGRFPENADEIAVEESFLADNDLDIQVGDTLDFIAGNRYSTDENGEKTYWAGNWNSSESFERLSEESCRVTAVLHGNRPTTGFDIIRGMDKGAVPVNNSVRICLENLDRTAIRQIKEIVGEYGITDYAINTEIMLSVFAFEGGSDSFRSLFLMMGIALAVVIGTAIILIYNSFGLSLAEKIRYLGMLASVGATGRQKRSSIYYESVLLGIPGIILGIILGLLGSYITLNLLGRRILESNMIAGTEGISGTIPLVVSLPLILVIAAGAAVTVLLSALVPALRASKITPVDALRQNNTIKVKSGRLKVNPLIKRIFGYEGELAYKNIKRNGLKGTVITVSIAVSIILFLSVNYFCKGVTRVNYYDLDLPYQLIVYCSYDEREKLKTDLKEMDGIQKVMSGDFIAFPFKTSKEVPQTANTDILNPDFLTDEYSNLYEKTEVFYVVIAEDEDFKELLKKNGLSERNYFDGELRGVLLNNYFHETRGSAIFNDDILGQKLMYDDPAGNPPAVEIGDFVKYDPAEDLFKMIPKATVSIYVPESMYFEKAVLNLSPDDLTVSYGVVTSEHTALYQKIGEMLQAEGYHNYSCSDLEESLETIKTFTLMLKTAMYGFTTLLTLIAIANIVNTISTGVILRRKEFAMFKSIGMTDRGFHKMIYLETFIYGIRALVTGIPVSLLISFFMYRSLESELFSFDIDWIMYALVILAVFAVVGFAMLLGIRRLKTDNIIEALKYDIV